MTSRSKHVATTNLSASKETHRMTTAHRLSNLFHIARTPRYAVSAAVCLVLAALMALPAAATAAPSWQLQGSQSPYLFPSGEAGSYTLTIKNTGDVATTGPITLTDTLPAVLTFTGVDSGPSFSCTGDGTVATPLNCTRTAPIGAGETASVRIDVAIGVPASAAINTATVSGGGAAADASLSDPIKFAPEFALRTFGSLTIDAAQSPYTVAGGHPDKNVTEFSVSLPGPLNGTYIKAPLGFLGNPAAVARCPVGRVPVQGAPNLCPPGSQIGIAVIKICSGCSEAQRAAAAVTTVPVFNIPPERGYPAQFVFKATQADVPTVFSVFPQPRTDSYGLTVATPNIPAVGAFSVDTTLFGTPSQYGSGDSPAPFLSNPVDCSEADPTWNIAVDSVSRAGSLLRLGVPDLSDSDWKTDSITAPPVTGCDNPALTSQFAQISLGVKPLQGAGATQADSPTGLAVDLNLPQSNDPTDPANTTFDPEIPQAPEPKDLTVTLPAGVSISSSSAGGLGACSDLASDPAGDQVHYDNVKSVTCPAASKIGSALAFSPLLATREPVTDKVTGAEPIPGDVYLLKPHPGDLPIGGGKQEGKFRLLIQLENPRYGINIKLPGIAVADKNTGQLTTVFTDNPQLPAKHLTVTLKGGPWASLATPVTCGSFQTTSTIVPWSTPGTPDAHPTASFNVSSGANGTPCPANAAARPFAPSMSAGTASNQAGASSPFTLHLARADGEGEISALEVTLPKGLAAKFVGVPYCPEAALAAAAAKSGVAEQANSSCPAATRIGAVTVGAGPGSNPFYTGGNAYLSGPYKGAPMSVSVITPAVAGPFDLGTVVSRNALFVDPDTAQGRVVSDPLPTILDGVPLRLRSIDVNLDRPDFTLNPTNCTPMSVNAKLTSVNGASSNPSSYFQVGNCKALKFKPGLSLALKGGTKRSDNPALTATLTAPPGQANIAQTTVLLPSSQYIDSAHVNNPCTRVQFNAGACPPSSILGTATAYTPLLEKPLTGPVYFRANGGERELPDMVVDLNGQIHVTLVGFIDAVTKKGSEESRVRTRFLSVPDAPVSKFVLSLKGGKKGLIENSKNLCKDKIGPATVQMIAQNGLVNNFGTKLKTSCKKGKKGKKAKKTQRSSARVSGLALTGW